MRVLVTGATGAIGSFTVEELGAADVPTVALSRTAAPPRWANVHGPVEFVPGDVTDYRRISEVIFRWEVTHIVHAAALVGSKSAEDYYRSVHVNVGGTANVLEAARVFDVQRVVYASAKGVYGPVEGRHGAPHYDPLPEDHPKRPHRIYDAEKLAGEHLGAAYRREHGVEFAALRFAATYGPGKAGAHGAMGIISSLVEGCYGGERVRHPQGSDQRNEFLYTRDAGRALYLATTADALRHDVYNVGPGRLSRLGDFVTAIRRALPDADIEVGPGEDYMQRSIQSYSLFDVRRAEEDLRFAARFDAESGVADYLSRLRRADDPDR